MRTLVFELKDGTEVETTYEMPYSIREQLAWEEKFGQSFYVVHRCLNAINEAGAAGREVDPADALQTTWILWFGWFRARPKLPARFDKFIELLEDYRGEEPEDDTEPPPEVPDLPEDAGEAPEVAAEGLDPTATEESSASIP